MANAVQDALLAALSPRPKRLASGACSVTSALLSARQIGTSAARSTNSE